MIGPCLAVYPAKTPAMKKSLIILLALTAWSCDLIIEPVIDTRYRIAGTYYVNEYSESTRTSTNYQITITRGFGNTVYLDNFYGAGLSVTGQLSGNRIDIYRQTRNGYEIQGVATIEFTSMRLTYSVRDNYSRTTDFCNSVATKW